MFALLENFFQIYKKVYFSNNYYMLKFNAVFFQVNSLKMMGFSGMIND